MNSAFRVFLFFGVSILFSYNIYSQSNPTDVSGLSVWLRSDTGIVVSGGKVSNWSDISGNGYVFNSPNSTANPGYILSGHPLKNKPVLDFDGINDGFRSDVPVVLNNLGTTVYIVAKIGSFTPYGAFLCYGANAAGSWNIRQRPGEAKITFIHGNSNGGAGLSNLNARDLTAEDYVILRASVNTSNDTWKVGENGIITDVAVEDFTQAASNSVTIGHRDDLFHSNMKLAELFIYNKELSISEDSLIINYLRDRYTPTLDLGPPVISVCDTIKKFDIGGYYKDILWSNNTTDSIIEVTQPGELSVWVKDVFDFESRDTVLLQNFQGPIVFNNIGDSISCSSNLLWQTGLNPLYYDFLWNNLSTADSLLITNSGNYWVVVTDTNGCATSSDTANIAFDDFSQTASLGNDIPLCVGNPIYLQTGASATNTYAWSGQASGSNDTVLASTPGDYILAVTNVNGCSKTDTINITISGIAPTASFTSNIVCFGGTTQFTDASTPPFGNNLQSWSWNFGEPISGLNNTSTQTNPTHTYADTGNYTVTLMVTTNAGCSQEIQKTIRVSPHPIADFTYSSNPNSFSANFYETSVTFDDRVFERFWFDNGTLFAHSLSPSKTFPVAGTYPIKLIVITKNGCIDSVEKNVTLPVTSPPQSNPTDVSGLSVWLRSDTGIVVSGGKVSNWSDISGNGYVFNSPNAAANPGYILSGHPLKNKPVLDFDGINDGFRSDVPVVLNGLGTTVYIVAKIGSFTPYGAFLCYGANTAGSWNIRQRPGEAKITFIHGATNGGAGLSNLNARDLTAEDYVILRASVNTSNGTWKVGENGIITDVASENFTQAASNSVTIGHRDDLYHSNMKLAEVFIYNKELSLSEDSLIISYLRDRYTPTLNLGPPAISVCDTIKKFDIGGYYKDILWSNNTTDSTIEVNQPGELSVWVKDVFDFESRDTVLLQNFQGPIAFNNIGDSIVCSSNLLWQTGLNSLYYNFLWNDISTADSLLITNSGNYWVVVTDTNGCATSSDTASIGFDNFSQTATLGNDTTLCSGNIINLVQGSNVASSYVWSDGSINNSIIIDTSGNYSVTVTNINQCQAIDSIYITVQGIAPTANFLTDDSCSQSSVIFMDASYSNDTSHITHWSWTTIENQSSLSQNPTFSFSQTGYIPVSLTIESSNNCKSSVTKNIRIYNPPVSNFSSSNIGCTNESINFLNTSFSDSSAINAYVWNFGNGQSIQVPNTSYSYPLSGTYTVVFKVIDNNGCSDSSFKNIQIFNTPKADFLFTNNCEKDSVQLIDNSSGVITSWNWNFGNQLFSHIPNPKTFYTQAGNFNVNLEVLDVNGCQNDTTITLYINPRPIIFYKGKDACLNTLHHLTDSSIAPSGSISNVVWNFQLENDSLIVQGAHAQIPVHSMDVPFTLSVTSNQGCINHQMDTIRIHSFAIADFSVENTFSQPPLNVNVINESSNASIYTWEINNDFYSNNTNITVAIVDTHAYQVVLIANNNFNCADTISKKIQIGNEGYDVAVENLDATLDKIYNEINVTMKVINKGKGVFNHLKFELESDKQNVLSEDWTSSIGLLPNDSMIYNFKTKIIPKNKALPKYMCVKVNALDLEENNYINNTTCINNSADDIYFLNMYPNPVSDGLTLEIYSEKVQELNGKVYQSDGKLVLEVKLALSVGLNRVKMDVNAIQSDGLYLLEINEQNILIRNPFIIKK